MTEITVSDAGTAGRKKGEEMAKEIGWFATRQEAAAEIRRMISAGKGTNTMRVEERPSRPVDSAAVAAGIVPASGSPVYYIVIA